MLAENVKRLIMSILLQFAMTMQGSVTKDSCKFHIWNFRIHRQREKKDHQIGLSFNDLLVNNQTLWGFLSLHLGLIKVFCFVEISGLPVIDPHTMPKTFPDASILTREQYQAQIMVASHHKGMITILQIRLNCSAISEVSVEHRAHRTEPLTAIYTPLW